MGVRQKGVVRFSAAYLPLVAMLLMSAFGASAAVLPGFTSHEITVEFNVVDMVCDPIVVSGKLLLPRPGGKTTIEVNDAIMSVVRPAFMRGSREFDRRGPWRIELDSSVAIEIILDQLLANPHVERASMVAQESELIGEIAASDFPAISEADMLYNGGLRHLYARRAGFELHPDSPTEGYVLPSGAPDFDLDLPQAWGITRGSEDVLVAVLDNGFFLDHPAFTDRIVVFDDPPGLNSDAGCPGDCGVDDDGDGLIDEDRNGFQITLEGAANWATGDLDDWVCRVSRNDGSVPTTMRIVTNAATVSGRTTVTIDSLDTFLSNWNAYQGPTNLPWQWEIALVTNGLDDDGDGVIDDLGYDPTLAFEDDDDESGYVDDASGYDFADNDADVLNPRSDHGTTVAGVLAHDWSTPRGVGVAPGLKFLPIKGVSTDPLPVCADITGPSLTEEIVRYCASRGVDVIVTAFKSASAVSAYSADLAYERFGILTTVGAANDGTEYLNFPSSEHAIRVAGLEDGSPHPNTNYHSGIQISASHVTNVPTFECDTLVPGYGDRGGTSLSSPQVGGVLALMKSANPHWDAEFMRAKLLASVKPVIMPSDPVLAARYEGKLGSGIVNAYRAMTYYGDLFPFYDQAEPSTHVVNWQGSVYLSGDLYIPAGQELVIAAGTVVEVGQDDIIEDGNYARQIEIVVDGTLTINGTAGNPVTFRMFGDEGLAPGKPVHNQYQTWGGFRLGETADFTPSHLVVEDLAPKSAVDAVPDTIVAPGQTVTLSWTHNGQEPAYTFVRTSIDGGQTFESSAGPATISTSADWTAPASAVGKDLVVRVEFRDAQGYAVSYQDITTIKVRESFANVSVESNMTIPQGSTPYASAPLDYDEDGLEDFVISYEVIATQLYKNDFDLVAGIRFDLRSIDLGSGSEQDTRGVNRIDVNNDGHIDVFLAANGTTTDSKLFLGDGTDLTAGSDPSTFATVNVKAVKSAAWGEVS